MSASKIHRAKEKALDKELTWLRSGAASTPIYFPDVPGEIERLEEKRNWQREQARLIACQHVSEFELSMLMKFEMLKWLECGFFDECG